jgi:hypothetical protein
MTTLKTHDIDPKNVGEVQQELARDSLLWAEDHGQSRFKTLPRQIVDVRLDPPAYQLEGWFRYWVRPGQIKRIVCHRMDYIKIALDIEVSDLCRVFGITK